MFELEVWQAPITDSQGNILPGAQITVFNSDDTVATIYDDLDRTPRSNPFTVGTDALARFYAEPGRYRVQAQSGSDIAVYDNVDLSQKAHRDDLASPESDVLIAGIPAKNRVISVDSIQALRDLPAAARRADVRVLVKGYYAGSDVGGGEFYFDPSIGTEDGGVNISVPGGRWVRLLDGFVTPEMFGAYRNGVTNDTPAFVAANNYAKTIVTEMQSDTDQATATVHLSAGSYRIESGGVDSVAVRRYSGVSFKGQGSGVTWVNHYGSGTAFKPEDSGPFLAFVRDEGYSLLDTGGSGLCGFHALRMIRACGADDVVVRSFFDNWKFNNTWTFELNNCVGLRSRNHNINAGTGTAELFINGGRYDVSENHNIYMNSGVGELILNTGAGQFSRKSGVRVDSARTVILRDGFFEGNCIGSLDDYYLHLNGNGDSLSSCVIDSCVINDLSDPNRVGLGAAFVDNFQSFHYKERWTRNAVKNVPVVGVGVQSVDLVVNNVADISDSITSDGGSNNFARVTQLARPYQFYGMDMDAGPSFAPQIRSTATFTGIDGKGVAIGTYGGTPTIQTYGATNNLQINMDRGSVGLGQSSASVAAGTNTFFGTYRNQTQLTSSNFTPASITGAVGVNCSDGQRTVTLTSIPHDTGREITIYKTDGGSNNLVINGGGSLINGQESVSGNSAYKSFVLISNGTDWFIKSQSA